MANLTKEEMHSLVFESLESAPTVMVGLNRNAEHSEPMHAIVQDTNRNQMWFFTDKKNRIASGGKATSQYVNTESNIFVSIVGQLVEESNADTIKEISTPVVDAFFEDGLLDKNLKVMRLDISEMEIWTRNVDMKTQFKLFMGITVEPEELGSHAVIETY